MTGAYWENNGEANAEGKFSATIDMGDGSGVQHFEGESHKEVADKLLQAQFSATAKIREQAQKLRETVQPVGDKPVLEFKRRAMSADEMVQTTRDLADPAKANEAVKRVVEAELGAPLDAVRDRLNEQQEEQLAAAAKAAGEQFVRDTPDYFVCPQNGQKIVAFVRLNRLDPTVTANYVVAYTELRDSGLLLPKPTEQPKGEGEQRGLPAEPPAPTVRARGSLSSSGLRAGDSSGDPGSRPTAPPKYTRAQIDAMGAAEYDAKLTGEAGFAALVDKLR